MNLLKFVVVGLILKRYEKTGVFMAKNKLSEEGFTLISTLISLSLILVSLPLMYHLVYEVKSTSKLELSPYKFIVFNILINYQDELVKVCVSWINNKKIRENRCFYGKK